MKWIDAEQKLEITIFDEQTDDHRVETMTIEEMLNTYTNEGCPEGYFNPENNWTPCSKGLPKKDGEYLVTDNGWPITIVDVDMFFGGTWLSHDNVVAWMPAPKPYKGEQDDE